MAEYSYAGLRVRVTADTGPMAQQIAREATRAGEQAAEKLSKEVTKGASKAGENAGKEITKSTSKAGENAGKEASGRLNKAMDSGLASTGQRIGARVGRALGTLIGQSAQGEQVGGKIGRAVGAGISAGFSIVRDAARKAADLIPEPFRQAVSRAGKAVADGLSGAFRGIRGAASAAAEQAKSVLGKITEAGSSISRGFSSAFDGVRNAASRAAALARQVLSRIGEAAAPVTGAFSRAFGGLQGAASRAAELAKSALSRLSEAASPVTAAFSRAFTAVRTAASRAAELGKQAFGKFSEAAAPVTGAFGRAFAAVQGAAGRAASAASGAFTRAVGAAGGAIQNSIGRAFANVSTSAGRSASSASAGFTRAAGSAGTAITNSLGKAFDAVSTQAARAASSVGQAFSRATEGGGAGGMLGGLLDTAKALPTPVKAGALAMGVLGGNIIKTGVEYNALNQRARAAFTTILGSGDAANQMMDQLTVFARSSPFPRQAFIEATQQMLGFGIESKKVVPYLDSIQNAVAATGGNAQTMSEITLVMSQIQAAGKITGVDLMQFAQRGINAAELIGQSMGKSGQQIKDEISSGTFDATKALDALAGGMQKQYGGAAANVKNTWVGATDRVKGAMRDIGSAIVAPFIDPQGGGMGVNWANQLATAMRAAIPVITALMTGLAWIFRALGTVIGWVVGFVIRFKDVLLALAAGAAVVLIAVYGMQVAMLAASLAVGIFNGVMTICTAVINFAKLAWLALQVAFVASPIGVIVVAVLALIAVFVVLWVRCEWFRTFWINLWNTIVSWVATAWTAIQTATMAAWNAIVGVISGAWNWIKTVIGTALTTVRTWIWLAWNAIKLSASAMWNGIKGVITGVWNAIRGAIGVVLSTIRTWIWTAWAAIRASASAMWNGIKSVITGVWGAIRGAIGSVLTTIRTWIWNAWAAIKLSASTMWNGIKGVVTGVWNAVRNAIGNVLGTIRTWIYNAWTAIKNSASTLWNQIKGVISGVWNAIKNAISGALNTVKTWISNAWKLIKLTTTQMWGQIGGAISNAWTNIKNAVRAAWQWIEGKLQAAWDRIKNGARNAWNGLLGIIKNVWNKVKETVRSPVRWVVNNVINKLINGINALITKIKIPKIPTIKGFAEGGRIPGGYGGGDRVPIMAEPGEWMLTKRQARGIGYNTLRNLPHYAAGGLVGSEHTAREPASPRFNLPGWIKSAGGGFAKVTGMDTLWKGGKALFDNVVGMLTYAAAEAFKAATKPLRQAIQPWVNHGKIFPEQWGGKTIINLIDKAIEFIQSKAMGACDAGGVVASAMKFDGGKYVFGAGSGPNPPFDCSSFINFIMGSNGLPLPDGFKVPSRQHGPTTNAWLSFGKMQRIPLGKTQPGDIAVNPQHMGLIIGKNGDGFAARSTATGIGKQNFARGYTYLRYKDAKGGGDPAASGPCGAGGGMSSEQWKKAGGGVRPWTGLVTRIANQLGIGQSAANWLKQIATESGGDPGIRQQVQDVNVGANAANGLLQVTPMAWKEAFGNRPYQPFNAALNIEAAMRYAKKRYGWPGLLRVIGHGHGYARGGVISEPVVGWGVRSGETYTIAERGPEIVSPLRGQPVDISPPRGGGQTVINVYPQPGQDERQIAAAVSRELAWAQAGGAR